MQSSFRPFFFGLVAVWLIGFWAIAGTAESAPRSLWLQDLTWPEVRELIGDGYDRILIPTGGIEQNGPHMVLGKHNYVVAHASEQIAEQVGHMFVAPVLAYVPEGDSYPPTGHMQFAGTISIPEEIFSATLESIARSLITHGFNHLFFIGDSGGNQASQQRVAEALNQEFAPRGIRVLNVEHYYDPNQNQQIKWLVSRGESERDIGTHAGIRDTSELLHIHPQGVREALLEASQNYEFLPNGVNGNPARASAEYGSHLMKLKIKAAVRQIKDFLSS